MKNLVKNSGKNCMSILFIALIAMMFSVQNSYADETTGTVVQIKAAFEGLYSENGVSLPKDAMVKVYLRNANSPYEIVGVAKGFINGRDMIGTFEFANIPTGQYYIVLKSINTIETWSSKGGELIASGSNIMYDFTTGKEKAFGDNMDYTYRNACIFTGDVNQDGFVSKFDVRAVLADIGLKGNLPTDLDGDKIVSNLDYDLAYANWERNVKSITPVNFLEVSVVKIKAAFEGLNNENSVILPKDAVVKAYLRNAESPYGIAGSAKGIIDGKDMMGTFEFANIPTGQYYIVLESKSTIETWSRLGGELIVNGSTTTFDFTTGKEKAFGDNMDYTYKYARIFTGDVDQDGFVSKNDVRVVLADIGLTGNVPSDLDGDEIVTNLDYDLAYVNWERNVQAITPLGEIDLVITPNIMSGLVVQVKAAFEGLYNENSVVLPKNAQVTVYLRNAEAPHEIAGSAKGFINGATMIGTFEFVNIPTGQYYIVLESKNTIQTWSRKGGEELVSGTIATYDFTTGKDKAFGENMDNRNKFACIFTGDVNQDGIVNKFDAKAVLGDIGITGDVLTDLDGDAIVTKLDYVIAYTNSERNIKAITPMGDLASLAPKIASKENFTLKQNSPNPFNPSTQIAFNVPITSNVKLSIYDMSGREVAQLVNTVLNAGSYSYQWNASNFASGTYFYRITANGFEQTKKMNLIK